MSDDSPTYLPADLSPVADHGIGNAVVVVPAPRDLVRKLLASADYDEHGSITQVVADARYIGVSRAHAADLEVVGEAMMGDAGCRGVWLQDEANCLVAFIVVWS